jgi:FMN reductase
MNPRRIAVVVGSTSEPSRTRVLAQGLVDALDRHLPLQTQWLELQRLAPHIGITGSARELPPEGAAAVRAIETADLVLAASPVYKGSYTGLFKHLFDLVAPDALVDRPVLLATTGGSDRHALVVDHQLRPLFAFFRALTVPSAVYASEGDFDGYTIRSDALRTRMAEAAAQAARLLTSQGTTRATPLHFASPVTA